MNILFYSPFNSRSRDSESLMIAFKNQGHRVISLSQSEGRLIHPYLESKGIETFTHPIQSTISLVYFFRQILFLIWFCRKHYVDIVYSHLESANFVAVISQYFIKATVIVNRHHIDEAALQGFDKSIFYKLTYSLAGKIIVVSNRAKEYITTAERIQSSKVVKINLAYDFGLYSPPNQEKVKAIQQEINADLVLLTVCRLTKFKRADLSIKLLKSLEECRVNAKLILLGSGVEEQRLKCLALAEGVEHRLLMPGHVDNVIDYLAASDFLVHPSILESSCVIVKEAAIAGLPVLVCNHVGDFDDYLVNGKNAFVVDRDSFVEESVAVLTLNYKNRQALAEMAKSLHEKVIELFGIDTILNHYDTLNSGQKN